MSNECSYEGVRRCPEFVRSPVSDNVLGGGHLHLGVVLVPAVHVHLEVLVNISDVIMNHGWCCKRLIGKLYNHGEGPY